MSSILITGANRGLGLEFARQYAVDGWTVHATARDPGRADALNALSGAVHVHRLDVTDPGSASALGKNLRDASIDILLNNAGIGAKERAELGDLDYDGWLEDFRINTIAPLRVTEALIEPVARSQRRVIGFLSSRAGSIGANIAGGRYRYRSTKAALNAVVRSLAIDLMPRGIICLALHPGWVRTDMGGDRAPLDRQTSVASVRALLDRLEHHHSGHFLNYDGAELPW